MRKLPLVTENKSTLYIGVQMRVSEYQTLMVIFVAMGHLWWTVSTMSAYISVSTDVHNI